MARIPGAGNYLAYPHPVAVSAAYTASEDDVVQATAGSAFTVTLPAVGTLSPGATVTVLKVDASANVVTVAPPAADVTAGVRINGASSDVTLAAQYNFHKYMAVGVSTTFGTEGTPTQWLKVS